MPAKKHKLIEIDWPDFGPCRRPPQPSADEFLARLERAREAMERQGLTHLVVYGDREHFANLAYLTGFDPRFEESILVLSRQATPLLVVGNECEGYLGASPLWREGKLRSERFQPFSLLSQPRDSSRLIADIVQDEGIGKESRIGCVGWKYFSDQEHHSGPHAIDLPAYLVDTLRSLASPKNVVNATAIFMHPGEGLRTFCSPAEIAYFEYTNIEAAQAMRRLIFSMKEGITDHELAQQARLNGEPLGCHMTLFTGCNPNGGLSSPIGATVRRGQPMSMNICYWGSNICRAGWVAASPRDLPAEARDYVENFAGIYFEVLAQWYGLLRIGTAGQDLDRLIREHLPFEKFGIYLNPGHLIHLDEWVSSPIFPGSDIPIHSGMAMQVDVIPSSATYFSTRMEDGVVIADGDLRKTLGDQYPECFERIKKRRTFMTEVLGIELPEEVLPLSNIPAIVPPFFLKPEIVFTLDA